MSNMKCPFCLQEMHKNQDNWFYCGTDYCELKHIEMPKKALEAFAESYQNRLNDCKRIGNLNEELIRTRKVLDKAKWWLHEIVESHRCTPISTAEMALKEITALDKGGDNE